MAERRTKRYKLNTPRDETSKAGSSDAPSSRMIGSNSSGGSRTAKFTNFHKSVFQILSSCGCLLDGELKIALNNIKGDFSAEELIPISPSPNTVPTDAELRGLFSFMNPELRKLSFEIKTVAIRKGNARGGSSLSTGSSSNEELIIYHGLVNTSDDKVAELEGSPLSAKETTLFKAIIEHLLIAKKLSTTDIQENVQTDKKMHQSDVEEILQKLIHERWLDRDDRNFIIIGPRSFLELKTVLEDLIENSDLVSGKDGDDPKEEEQRAREVAALKSGLPQILLH